MLNHKLIYIIVLFILLPLLGISQILSLEDFSQHSDGVPLPENITYIKDVNNSLTPYIGVWEGVYDTNTITFTVVKVTEPFSDGDTMFFDYLKIDFKVVDAAHAVIIETSVMPNVDNPRLEGFEINSTAYSGYWYYTENGDYLCYTKGMFFLKLIENRYAANKLVVALHEPSRMVGQGDCPNGFYNIPLPQEVEFELIKQ